MKEIEIRGAEVVGADPEDVVYGFERILEMVPEPYSGAPPSDPGRMRVLEEGSRVVVESEEHGSLVVDTEGGFIYPFGPVDRIVSEMKGFISIWGSRSE